MAWRQGWPLVALAVALASAITIRKPPYDDNVLIFEPGLLRRATINVTFDRPFPFGAGGGRSFPCLDDPPIYLCQLHNVCERLISNKSTLVQHLLLASTHLELG